MKRLILELSVKPFRVMTDDAIRAVVADICSQWHNLISRADSLSFMLWTADGSEILDYRGNPEDEISYAKWIGIANDPPHDKWHDALKCLHTQRFPYCENPPRLTYERLAFIISALKSESARLTGKPVTVGTTFDPGPEFAESEFKYKRHPELSKGEIMGAARWVHCAAVLHADKIAYAGFPNGIEEGTTLGTFLGRQAQHFLKDLNLDYIWFSNGFGYSLDSWNVTGEAFDGKTFDNSVAPKVHSAILKFWHDFRKECPHYKIESRGSNLSTGMDLSTDASPMREIYRGGFNVIAPVNSPWAALNGDYGLELVGWLSHIAELPAGSGVPFRYYIHDPWWMNSPWLDRYGREAHDIYLPLSVGRIDEKGEMAFPASVSMLTIDNSYGQMPQVVPNEVTPHILRALDDYPNQPGLITWIYPFEEYHEWTFAKPSRANEVFFGDWFIRSAINQGFPLNTVVSTENYLSSLKAKPELYQDTILVCPPPDAGSALAKALIAHLNSGGKALLYGPIGHADPEVLALLELKTASPLPSGVLEFSTTLAADPLADGKFPTRLEFRDWLSGGDINTVAPEKPSAGLTVLAEVASGNERRAFAVTRKLASGGQLGWVRGIFSEDVVKGQNLPKKTDPLQWFTSERVMRWALQSFGYTIRFAKPSAATVDPLILAARKQNGWFFSGFSPSTNIQLHWQFPLGVPVPVGCDVLLKNGTGSMVLSRAWHRECRVFVEQNESSEVSCREHLTGDVDIARRFQVWGLKNATVHYFIDPAYPAKDVYFSQNNAYTGRGTVIPHTETQPGVLTAKNVTGDILISCRMKTPLTPTPFNI